MARSQSSSEEELLVGQGSPAIDYVAQQFSSAIDYYDKASRTARGASLQYVAIARSCYVLSGLIMALTVAGVWEQILATPSDFVDIAARIGLPASAPKWSVGILTVGYLCSQYSQRRGFTRAWTRYAETEQRIRGLKRQFTVSVIADPSAQAALCIGAVGDLNGLIDEETQRWARDLMMDFDRVHALLDQSARSAGEPADRAERPATSGA